MQGFEEKDQRTQREPNSSARLPDARPNHYTTEQHSRNVKVSYLTQVNQKKAIDCKYKDTLPGASLLGGGHCAMAPPLGC